MLHSPPGQPVPVLSHSQLKKCFQVFRWSLLCSSSCPLHLVPSTRHHCKEPVKHPLLWLNSPEPFQLREVLQSLHHLDGPLFDCTQCICVSCTGETSTVCNTLGVALSHRAEFRSFHSAYCQHYEKTCGYVLTDSKAACG